MWWNHGVGWGWMVGGGLMMLLFWGVLIFLVGLGIWALIRSGQQRSGDSSQTSVAKQDRALEILKERYARGEITKTEYEEMRNDIRT